VNVSVVIPCLDEEDRILAALDALAVEHPFEVLVVDGGSRDRTLELASGWIGGGRVNGVFTETAGLASQLNRGLREARGDAVLFLHADSALPAGALAALVAALTDDRVVGGSFRLGFDSDRPIFRLTAGLANLRNRLGFGPFGDQAIFARRAVLDAVGGFDPDRFLEDLDLVRRLRRRGRFRVLSAVVRTSTRRWNRYGVLRTIAVHWCMSTAYLLGKRQRRGWFGARVDGLRRIR